jgi:hypothetical protein
MRACHPELLSICAKLDMQHEVVERGLHPEELRDSTYAWENLNFRSGFDISAKTFAGYLVDPRAEVEFRLLGSMLNFTLFMVSTRMSQSLLP